MKVNILIVDDEQELREVIGEELVLEDFECHFAKSGNDALKFLFNKQSPEVDIILSDIRMEDGNGIYLLEKLKEEKPDHPPLYFYSGYSEYDKVLTMAKGAQDHFAKPLKVDFLIEQFKKNHPALFNHKKD